MNCPICKHSATPFIHEALQKRFNYCTVCECIYLDKTFKLSEEKEKEKYDQHQNSLDNVGYVEMFENFLDFFWEELTCKPLVGLDFGSGPTPVLSELMQRRGATIDCYDKFYQPLPLYEHKQYDFITSTEVFEHLDNPYEALKLLTNLVKPDGIIALMTLFHDTNREHFLTWWYPRDLTHITFYTPKTLTILGTMCGLKVLKTDSKRILILKKCSET
ncbi:MAG: class I SAM-dependent methyltransferase [Sulfurospirillaceae bacterium]|nr:class I SAM-dependent methyltransferase [Sulfurospirillaceae bacterium]MDD2825416.1 class I SAM-dependent methyltransferase [Sulfurospirillaceae bacterium]